MDKLDEALAAAAKLTVTMRQFNVTISSTGHPAVLALPEDATDAEIAEVAGWLLTAVMNGYRAERAKSPAARLIVPAVALPRN
jgi:hypothetical protein